MQYRPEIDGLRAVAVIPVILFHAGFSAFSGGYIGVDIFFVISGYLITAIILSDLNNDRFSIVTFYERRARRILPALFFVMICCLPFVWMWLFPADTKDFFQSLIAVSVFSSNVLFWKESGYFGVASELKPLIHTWSLAVEEQYYLLFPLFLILLWKIRKRWLFGSLAIVGVISFVVAQWGSHTYPSASFFLLPTRAWELALGALIAFCFMYRNKQIEFVRSKKQICEVFSIAGLMLIVYPIYFFDDSTPFPGAHALIPTIGTGLIIIFATTETLIGRLLSNRFMVGIGLISYSLYLWHQPLFAFARHRSILEPSSVLMLALSALSILLAYISWRFIEGPFRNKRVVTRKKIFTFAVFGSIAFFIIGVIGHFNNGFTSRIDKTTLKIYEAKMGRLETCKEFEILEPGQHTCILGDTRKNISIAIIGDSHSSAITKALSNKLEEHGLAAIVYSQPWGIPFIDVGTDNVHKGPGNREFYNAAFKKVVSNPDIMHVFLTAEWANYTKGMRWGDATPSYYTDNQSQKRDLDENIKVFKRGLKRTLDKLIENNKSVLVVGSVPEYKVKIPNYLAKQHYFTKSAELAPEYIINKDEYSSRNMEVLDAFKAIQQYKDVKYINTYNIFCRVNKCDYMDNYYNVFYNDGNHLTYHGSLPLVESILEALLKHNN